MIHVLCITCIGSHPGPNDTPSFSLEDVLHCGQVPPAIKSHVDRKELVKKVRDELYKLKESDGWVLIHGLGGFGKTTLAAESVRCAPLLQDVFPGGVFWLSVNKMRSRGEVDKSKLLEKLQNLIRRVDKNKDLCVPPNIEAATDYLLKVMKEQHPCSLLILDDIWEKEVAKAFSVRCRVLVTSRNADVASEVYTPSVYPVCITEGLSDDEARQLLSRKTNKLLDALPKEADDIIQFCMGSPLALGIIAAKLSKPNTSRARWKSVVQQLKSKSRANDVRANANASIELSIEDLSEESKDKFSSLVVFAYSAVISTRVLNVFWGMDEFGGSEDVMDSELSVCLCA